MSCFSSGSWAKLYANSPAFLSSHTSSPSPPSGAGLPPGCLRAQSQITQSTQAVLPGKATSLASRIFPANSNRSGITLGYSCTLGWTARSKLGFVQGLKPPIDSLSAIHSQGSLELMTLPSLQQAPAGLGKASNQCKESRASPTASPREARYTLLLPLKGADPTARVLDNLLLITAHSHSVLRKQKAHLSTPSTHVEIGQERWEDPLRFSLNTAWEKETVWKGAACFLPSQ